jgi:F0F1-type ATP synthase assembly protein I
MIKNFLDADEEQNEPTMASVDSSIFGGLNAEPADNNPETEDFDPFAASDFRIDPTPVVSPQAEKQRRTAPHNDPFPYTPPTAAESSRMSGLAFTAGIAFVSSVVFMLVLGWLVDTLVGTAPWGIVGGIVLGSIIGFIQFFRLNSQILNSGKTSQPTSFLDLGEKKPSDETPGQAPVADPEKNRY